MNRFDKIKARIEFMKGIIIKELGQDFYDVIFEALIIASDMEARNVRIRRDLECSIKDKMTNEGSD